MPRRRVLIIALVSVLLIGAGWGYVRYQQQYPSTSDAYVGMHVVRIAALVGGPVSTVAVHSHQVVRNGDLLFKIDPAPFDLAIQQAAARLQQAKDALGAADAQVAAAQAQVRAAQAALQAAQRHSARILDLAGKGTASKDQGDEAKSALQDAQDGLATAQAELTAAQARRGNAGDTNAAIVQAAAALGQARLDRQHTTIVAPADGIVGDVALRPGSYVNAGDAQFALVETGEVWVDANFKETDLVRIHPGESARVTVDLQPDKTYKGQVESLSPASGTAFALLPPENATGNWVKVTQRFPVRVRILDPTAGLRVGASSEVTIDTVAVGD